MVTQSILYIYIFLLGILVGSFLNVCIYRIPRGEDIVFTRSHCMSCGYVLKWYDLIPIFSWVCLRGRCRKCQESVSPQYPLVELANGLLWIINFALLGVSVNTALACGVFSALLVLSVIDARTQEIPFGINVFIFALGVIHVFVNRQQRLEFLVGMVLVSGVLLVVFVLSGGRAIGGGDVKLMAAAGLFLGWKLIVMAFLFGCFYGSVIHIARMKLSNAEHVLAMGPYLAAGIVTAIWFGDRLLMWYLSFFI